MSSLIVFVAAMVILGVLFTIAFYSISLQRKAVTKQANAMEAVDKSMVRQEEAVALQRKAVVWQTEALALSRENNRILTEILKALQDSGAEHQSAPPNGGPAAPAANPGALDRTPSVS